MPVPPWFHLAVLVAAVVLVAGCQSTVRTRTAVNQPSPSESAEEPTEVPTMAIVAAIVIVALAAAPAFEALNSAWPPE